MIREKLRNGEVLASYMNCFNALVRIKVDFFESDTKQYGLVSSYVAQLKNQSHKVEHDIVKMNLSD